uniref:WH2 domain-containing protein n=1 Tax=Macrostomum lignano TaxID=282301 RepID=A0A1I8FCT0_9PLAT
DSEKDPTNNLYKKPADPARVQRGLDEPQAAEDLTKAITGRIVSCRVMRATRPRGTRQQTSATGGRLHPVREGAGRPHRHRLHQQARRQPRQKKYGCLDRSRPSWRQDQSAQEAGGPPPLPPPHPLREASARTATPCSTASEARGAVATPTSVRQLAAAAAGSRLPQPPPLPPPAVASWELGSCRWASCSRAPRQPPPAAAAAAAAAGYRGQGGAGAGRAGLSAWRQLLQAGSIYSHHQPHHHQVPVSAMPALPDRLLVGCGGRGGCRLQPASGGRCRRPVRRLHVRGRPAAAADDGGHRSNCFMFQMLQNPQQQQQQQHSSSQPPPPPPPPNLRDCPALAP